MRDPLDWGKARRRLSLAAAEAGYPEELAEMLAKHLRNPRAMERMAAYLSCVRPKSMEMIADELVAITSDAETWRKKKESREAQAGYSAWLSSDLRYRGGEEDE